MGFPRILSKNNKIYTKLGEFCLSSDGTHFWIVCHTCQEELQTQDHFWKHIQDEHNFLHGLKQEHNRTATSTGGFMDTDSTPAPLLPLPLYRKQLDDDQSDESQEQLEPKDYTEMRAIEPNQVEIDIKVEPAATLAGQAVAGQVGVGGAATLYQLPQVPTAISTYATIMHTPGMPQLGMAIAPCVPGGSSAILPQDLPKDSNSTTASASSAVSSDDGERWYICDFESCGLKFKYQSRLELHRSVHSKDRKFACELCGASFKQSCNLSTHRKKKHFLKGSKSVSMMQQRF